MSNPPPLPPARQDPAVAGALAEQEIYQSRRAAIDDDTSLTPLARAEAIAQAYTESSQIIERHAKDLRDRRTARLEHLRSQLPIGPGVPADASPADRAVLVAEFRAALERARSAHGQDAKRLLAEAIRFGDEATVRAVLTVAAERGEPQLLDQWAEAEGKQDLLAELRELESALNGAGPDALWESKAFRPLNRPIEVANLPFMRRQAEQEAREAEQRRRLATPAYRRY